MPSVKTHLHLFEIFGLFRTSRAGAMAAPALLRTPHALSLHLAGSGLSKPSTLISQPQVAGKQLDFLAGAEDDVDEGGDIRDIHIAVAIHIGTSLIFGNDAQNHVDQGGDIRDIDLAVAVHIPLDAP